MFKTLILKEFKNILLSPKFIYTFLTASVLILLSVYIGIQEYETAMRQYENGMRLSEQLLQERSGWNGASTTVFRKPDVMQIFVSGINNDAGRMSDISKQEPVKLRSSMFADDPIFAVFRTIDLAFIIQVVLSLLAILFTYDAINGERENGTLKLVLSNAVPKSKYLLAKLAGLWSGLIVPLSIPVLLSLLMVMIFNIPMSGVWQRLALFFGLGLLYFTFFICCGLLASALTRSSSASFLFLLVFWITAVLIIPRIGTMAAGQFVETKGQAELESQISAYSNQQWKKYETYLRNIWAERNQMSEHMTPEERESFRDEKTWEWLEQDEAERNKMQEDLTLYTRSLKEEMVNKKKLQEDLGLSLARISPASAFMLGAMNIAESDIHLKNRTESEMDKYKDTFTRFSEKKAEEDGGGGGGIQITMDSERGLSISMSEMKKRLDLNEMPRYIEETQTTAQIFRQTIIDFTILIIMSFLAFAGSFVSFVHYDVR